MVLRTVFLILAALCFGLHAMDVRHQRINLQSAGLTSLAIALLFGGAL